MLRDVLRKLRPGLSMVDKPMLDYCPHIYKGPVCGYRGDLIRCGRTEADCKLHDNHERFGGIPIIPREE